MSDGASRTPPDRNLALELVRVTEAAAMGASRWIGRGDKNAADQAAVDLMRIPNGEGRADGTTRDRTDFRLAAPRTQAEPPALSD